MVRTVYLVLGILVGILATQHVVAKIVAPLDRAYSDYAQLSAFRGYKDGWDAATTHVASAAAYTIERCYQELRLAQRYNGVMIKEMQMCKEGIALE